MNLPALTLPADVPVLTVLIDSTRSDDGRNGVVLDRWADLQRALVLDGVEEAPQDDIDAVTSALDRATWVHGPHGRILVAAGGQVLLDSILPEPVTTGEAVVSDRPHALALGYAADAAALYLVVESDRAGAHLTLHEASAAVGSKTLEDRDVDGDHDVLTKVRPSRELPRDRVNNRAEDSWERNAETVAAEVDQVMARDKPDLVLLTGDVRSTAYVEQALGTHAREALVDVPGGARAEGVNSRAFAAAVDEVITDFRMRRRQQVLDRFQQESGRDGAAVSGLDDVVAVLRRGQVSELVLDAGAFSTPHLRLSEHQLWIGDGPLQLGASQEDLSDLGVAEPRRVRADLALSRAVLDQSAGITLAEELDVPDGVAAVLRWDDAGTPAESAYTLSGDSGRAQPAAQEAAQEEPPSL
ncbi:hypothetical protein LQF12_05725 [Ruania suaedae]|uniref:baeRF2 domain-containing protein n=1 Tax=Ruania suaedae TaxID=2897774 RepID=UPI001E54BA5F|nr:hypothetical protein [Ruania suaedae]UFU04087.1 hypothetical protein LQF12_05725 [Ruania suaedae]